MFGSHAREHAFSLLEKSGFPYFACPLHKVEVECVLPVWLAFPKEAPSHSLK